MATAELIEGGATVPFIARYRKEVTGGLDEVAIIAVRDRLGQLRDLAGRRNAILKSLQEQGKLTDELKAAVAGAATMTALEDLYLPYRPKRRTRGTSPKEKGLEPLAKLLFDQGASDPRPTDGHEQGAGRRARDRHRVAESRARALPSEALLQLPRQLDVDGRHSR